MLSVIKQRGEIYEECLESKSTVVYFPTVRDTMTVEFKKTEQELLIDLQNCLSLQKPWTHTDS